jgi:two-component system phosphate regulon response regulator PhoB
MRVLVVEDEPALRESLRSRLVATGAVVDVAADGEEGLHLGLEYPIDVAIIDLGLPRLPGLELIRRLRASERRFPILVLTARDGWQEKVQGLEAGADDYVAKPFAMDALLARIRAVLRRAGTVAQKGQLSFFDLMMDQDAHRVMRNGRMLHLGPTEYRMLEFLMTHPGRVFSREQLLDAIWGRDIHVEPRTVDVHIRRLRKAINGPGEADVVRTVRSAGYALDRPEA